MTENIAEKLKDNIKILVEKGQFQEAKSLLEEYKKITVDDIEVYSIMGVIAMIEGDVNKSEDILKTGLNIDSNNFNLLYNLAYLYQSIGQSESAIKYYKKAMQNTNIKEDIDEVYEALQGLGVNDSKERILGSIIVDKDKIVHKEVEVKTGAIDEMENYKKQFKKNIEILIEEGLLKEAKDALKQYEDIVKDDIDIYSIKSVIAMMEGNMEKAEKALKERLSIDSYNFDFTYDLACFYKGTKQKKLAIKYYKRAFNNSNNKKEEEKTYKALKELGVKEKLEKLAVVKKKKIVFFSKGDDKFIWDIINELSNEYETKKITITKDEEFKLIDEWMEWADVCWFEWCDELIIYGSQLSLAKEKKILCRLHRYEALTQNPTKVNWANVDKLIIVTDHLKVFLKSQIPDIEKKVDIVTINNGVNLDKYKFEERKAGYNLAYVGYIHQRKNPVLLLQIIKKLVEKDKNYKLYVAGRFQDILVKAYWDYQIKKMNLERNIIFEGWQESIDEWLQDKNYLLSTSIHESFGYGIAEAMSRGLKPIIHDFIFSDEIWEGKYVFNTIDEAVEMIISEEYNSIEYRKFIEENYSLTKQINKTEEILNNLINPNYYLIQFNLDNKTNYRLERNYILRDNEQLEFFMNPWLTYKANNIGLEYEIVLQQIQNQFKYISELYFNGESNLNAYAIYFNYLLELLQHEDLLKEKGVIDFFADIKKERDLNMKLIEKTLFSIYPVLRKKFKSAKLDIKSYKIQDEYKDKYFSNNDKVVKELYYKLFQSIEHAKKFIKTFIIHGSLSTMDYTKYSDVDTLIILKDEVFKSMSNMRACREQLSKATMHLFEYDHLQHHKFFFVTEMDLLNYPKSYLPVELFKYSTLVYGEGEVELNLRECFLENLYSVWSMAYGFRQTYITRNFPNNLFSLKRYTSRLMLLPCLYLELFHDVYPYKKHSFDLAKKYFTKEEWKAIEIATKLRESWDGINEIDINDSFYYYTWKLSETIIKEIYDSNVITKYFHYFEGGIK